jgi:hypothetical protein
MIYAFKKLYNFFGTLLSVLLIASVVPIICDFVLFLIYKNYIIGSDVLNLYSIYTAISITKKVIFYLFVVVCIFYVIKGIIKLIAARSNKKVAKASANAKIIILRGVVGIFFIYLLYLLYFTIGVIFSLFGIEIFWGSIGTIFN